MHSIHDKIGQIVGAVAPLPLLAAHTQVDEGHVPGKICGGSLRGVPDHLGTLDDKAAHQLKGVAFIEGTGPHIGIEAGEEVLVEASQGSAALVLLHKKQRLDGPDGLQRLLKGLRRTGRHPGIDLGDLYQFGPAPGVRLSFGQFLGIIGEAAGVDEDSLTGFNGGLIEGNLTQVWGGIHGELRQMGFGLILDAIDPLGKQDDVITGAGIAATAGMMIGQIAHAGLGREFPQTLPAKRRLTRLIEGASFPKGEDLFTQDPLIVFVNHVGVLGPRPDGIELIPYPSPGRIRREGACACLATGVADNQFVFLNQHRRGFTGFFKTHRPTQIVR